jgi:segregation and condensation protein B
MRDRPSAPTGDVDVDDPISTVAGRDDVAVSIQTPLPAASDSRDPDDIEALIEALLLAAPQAATVDELARGAEMEADEVERALAAIEQRADRGWVVQRHRDTIQLATAPRFASHVRRFLNLDRETRLSGAALETLAVIAYQQPVTRAEIEAVRGVDCAGVLATLHDRALIEQLGRLDTVGHPIQYGTTPAFLRHFGFRSLAEMPALGQINGRDARLLLDAATASAGLETDTEGQEQRA